MKDGFKFRGTFNPSCDDELNVEVKLIVLIFVKFNYEYVFVGWRIPVWVAAPDCYFF